MALTLADYRSFVKHALGGGDPNAVYTDVNTTKDQIINQAGRYMVLAHPWSFRTRPPFTVTAAIQSQFLELPPDFGELDSIWTSDGVNFATSPTTLSHITALRSDSSDTDTFTWYAIAWPGQETKDQLQPNPRLEFWPDVTAGTSFRVEYKAGWVKLVNATDVPNIPETFEHLLQKYIRAFAKEQDDEQEQAIDAVDNSSVFQRLVNAQSRTQWDHGPSRGGAAQHATLGGVFRSGLVPDPT